MAGLFALCALVAGIFIYRYVSSEEGQKVVSAVTSSAALLSEATSAPGTNELRAIGCDTAMVVDVNRMQAIADAFDGGKDAFTGGARTIVSCQPRWGTPSPECDAVAAAYVAAVQRAPGPFVVTVGGKPGDNPHCQAVYSATGVKLTKTSPSE